MLRVSFAVDGCKPAPLAGAPAVALALRVSVAEGVPVHAVLLRCEARIEAARRAYAPPER